MMVCKPWCALAVLVPLLNLASCSPDRDGSDEAEPEPTATRTISGIVALPTGSPAQRSSVQILTTSSSRAVESDGAYKAEVSGRQGQLVMAVAEDAAGEPRALLYRVAVPGDEGPIDAATTARSLVLLSPLIAQSDGDALRDINAVVAGVAEVQALASAIEEGLGAGKYLDDLAAEESFHQAFGTAVNASLKALQEHAIETNQAGLSQSPYPIRVSPFNEVAGIQVVPEDGSYVTVRNRGRRWLSAYVGAPGDDELVGLVESPPSVFSLETLFQGTILTVNEQTIDLSGGSGEVDLRLYGLGLAGPRADCPSPGAGDVRMLVPALATVFDNFLTPTLNIITGLNLTTLSVYQDFLVHLAIGVLADGTCVQAMADQDWPGVAKCVFSSAASVASPGFW